MKSADIESPKLIWIKFSVNHWKKVDRVEAEGDDHGCGLVLGKVGLVPVEAEEAVNAVRHLWHGVALK
jgi:hypothetical protein